MSRAGAAACAIVVALLAGSACVGPSRTDDDYSLKAASTAEQVESAVQTGRLAAEAAGGGRATVNYLSVLISEAEDDAGSAASQFNSIQPPSEASDAVRDELNELLDVATTQLGDLRIAIRRSDVDAVAAMAEPLADTADQLDQFAEDHG